MNNIVNEDDFKYYMQDIERNYFGARYSYNEILANEMTPFKFKTIISKYLTDKIDLDTLLESHFYYITPDSFEYQVYKQLKTRIRVVEYKNSQDEGKGFKEKIYTMEELARISPEDKEKRGMIIREIFISKLALFAFSV